MTEGRSHGTLAPQELTQIACGAFDRHMQCSDTQRRLLLGSLRVFLPLPLPFPLSAVTETLMIASECLQQPWLPDVF